MKTFKPAIFENLENFLEFCAETPEDLRKSSKNNSPSFSNTRSIGEAFSNARIGINVDSVATGIDRANHGHNEKIIDIVWDVQGSQVDIGAYLNGEPECMIDFPVVQNTKLVNVVVDIGENASFDAKKMENKAICLSNMIDSLEQLNYRIKLDLICGNGYESSPSNSYAILVNIKRYHEPLSIGQITGCFHPGFLRRIIFLFWERMNPENPGYNSPALHGEREMLDCAKTVIESENVMLFPNSNCGGFDFSTIEGTKKWIERWANFDLWTSKEHKN